MPLPIEWHGLKGVGEGDFRNQRIIVQVWLHTRIGKFFDKTSKTEKKAGYMNVKTIQVGVLEVNSYLVYHENSEDAFLIDPGADAEQIRETVRQCGKQIKAVLLTHGHVDHIGALPELAADGHVPVFLHADDVRLYHSPDNAITGLISAVSGLPETRDDFLENFPDAPRVLHTPGHTPGSVCFYFQQEGILFSGDTLFCQSVGRTDLPGGSSERMAESLDNKIIPLPEEVSVYPGHGPSTSVGTERTRNTLLKKLVSA